MKESRVSANDGKMVRIVDAARDLGLSVSTVSRALSGKGRVSEGTRRRVVEWTRQNSWLPGSVSRTLQHGKSGNIAILLPAQPLDEVTPFFHYYVLGVCETAAAYDYDVIVTSVSENDPASLQALLDKNKIDGAVFTNREGDAFFQLLEDYGIPCVLIGRRMGREVVSVDHDAAAACCELTGILLDNGLSRLAYMGGNSTHVANQYREQGFINGFKIKGRQHDPSLMFTGMDSPLRIEQTVQKLLNRGVQGVITSDDVICSQVMALLHWLGVRVPDEMQVASFHHSFLTDIQSPQVSCVKIDPKMLSGMATKLLISLIHGKHVPPLNLVEYEICIRGSTRRHLGGGTG